MNIFSVGISFIENKAYPYRVICRIKGKFWNIGYFSTEFSARQAYKEAKETEIKRIANLYKNDLPSNVYLFLINYDADKLIK